MKIFRCGVLFVGLYGLLTLRGISQDAPKPVLSPAPLSDERMTIYRDFLHSYDNGSKTVLNISQLTGQLWVQDDDRKGCLKDFAPSDLETPVIHTFSADAFPSEKVRLVDPKSHKRADPGDAIRHGASVEDAVTSGFAAGIFTFSEIVFDTSHTHAAFSYSFVCGSLCGNGGVVIYELQAGKWRPSKTSCGSWIS
jgi:hypothetical protein